MILLACMACCTLAAAAGRPYDVLDYNASLRIDTVMKRIDGEVTIRLKSSANIMRAIELDAAGLEVEHVTADGKNLRFTHEGGLLNISLASRLRKGSEISLTVRYGGSPTRGLTFSEGQFYTQFHTSYWLVCNDDPADRATLTLTLDIPAGLRAVATGAQITPELSADGRSRTVWRLGTPHSSYLFGFAAGRFTVTEKTAGSDTLLFMSAGYTPQEMDRIFESTFPALQFFTRRSGLPLPGGRYTQVLVRGNAQQELAWMTVISEDYGRQVLAEPREDWLVVHELSHQWWGNLLTCGSWSEIWLNEGFATFMTAAFKEERWGRDEYDREMTMARLRYDRVLHSGKDRPLFFTGWDSPEDANGVIPYYKGALVLHLLRYQIGDAAFWDGLERYTRRHAGGSVTGADVRAAMEEAAGADLGRFFKQWVDGTGVPALVCSYEVRDREVVISIEQKVAPWHLPLQIAVQSEGGRQMRRVEITGTKHVERFPITGRLLSVRFDDGGYLPFSIPCDLPFDMLIFQAANEPDVAGRVDALLAIEMTAAGRSTAEWGEIDKLLADRAINDSSRIVRSFAARIQENLTKVGRPEDEDW